MNRSYLYPKWLCSFIVLLYALSMNAQTMFEYWFDNYSDPKSISLMISSGTISPTLDASGLSHGFHTLCMRLRNADGMYSPVSSSLFFKHEGDGVSKIEYWFEDNVSNMGTTEFDATTEEEQGLYLDLSDSEKFPLGVHQLNMRVAVDGGFYSPIYSALVLRLPNGSGNSVLEYWFDDDISKMATIPVDIEKGDVQKLDLDLTNKAYFPLGFHKLNMRIASFGNQYSPIYSSYVMRVPDGTKSQITYWLDNDYKNKRVVEGKVSNGVTTILMTSLDFSNASSGMHRLKYRIAAKGVEVGTIYEVPVLVTRRYLDQPDVTIVSEFYAYDKFSKLSALGGNSQSVVTRSYILDPADFEVGEHVFSVRYKNSAEVWSESNVTYFYKEAPNRLRIGKKPTDEMDDAANIDETITDDASYQIYTLEGKRVENLQPGLNILRYSNGRTKKVFVRYSLVE